MALTINIDSVANDIDKVVTLSNLVILMALARLGLVLNIVESVQDQS